MVGPSFSSYCCFVCLLSSLRLHYPFLLPFYLSCRRLLHLDPTSSMHPPTTSPHHALPPPHMVDARKVELAPVRHHLSPAVRLYKETQIYVCMIEIYMTVAPFYPW